MRTEVKTYIIRCDGCHKTMASKDKLFLFRVGPCGLTDYFRTEEVCGICAPKYRANYYEYT